MIWFFLLSGLFLGWSLGANDAANIIGTAVGTRMVRFRIAALIASFAVILGAVVGGSGTTETLASLGAVNALAGSFTVCLAAGLTVAWISYLRLPVSTSQTIVGAIIGWNLFTGSETNLRTVAGIGSVWVVSLVMAAALAAILYLLMRAILARTHIHLLELDAYTRAGLILAGAFGAYALGANNIANVIGAFVHALPLAPVDLPLGVTLHGSQLLLLLGGLSIAAGILTGSQRVMATVGSQLFQLTPLLALVVVLAHSLVLFVFSSSGLRDLIQSLGLPALPLVPVSSTHAIVGAILGVAIARGSGAAIRYSLLGKIVLVWMVAPVIACLLCFVSLFFVQNVFQLEVVASG